MRHAVGKCAQNLTPSQYRLPNEGRAGLTTEKDPFGTPIYLVWGYLLLDFARPQDTIPGLSMLGLGMVVTGSLALALLVKGRTKLSDRETKLFIGLLVLMGLHVPFARNNSFAFHTAKLMVLTFISYMSIITFLDSSRKIMVTMTGWMFIHIILAIVGIMKGGVGVGGWVEDENDLCMELNAGLAFSLFMGLSARSWFSKLGFLGVSSAFVLSIVATLSRGGFIGLLAVSGYCWLRSSKKLVSAMVACALILIMGLLAPEKYWKEVQSITSEEEVENGTGGERLYTWEVGWDMFLANPILGVGQGNFPWAFGAYEEGRTFRGHSLAGRLAHSLYFTLFPELGLVGGTLFLFMGICMVRNCKVVYEEWKTADKLGESRKEELNKAAYIARGIEGGLVGYLISSIFISTLYYPTFWILLAFSVALRKVYVPTSRQAETVDPFRLTKLRKL